MCTMSVAAIGRWARRAVATFNQRSVGTGAAVMLLATVVVVAAVNADGTKATNIQLDDAAVWVSNQATGQVGRLNTRADELDIAKSAGADADVVQWGRDVMHTSPDGGIVKLDVATGETTGSASAAFGDLQVNGGVATMFDATTGRLWVGPSTEMVGSEYPKRADAELPQGSRVVVTMGDGNSGGRVFVVGSSEWFELELNDAHKPVRDEVATTVSESTIASSGTPESEPGDAVAPIRAPHVKQLPREVGESTAITSVGNRLVFLTAEGELFSTSGDVARIPGESAVLQQPGPQNGRVLVASTAGLFEVSIGSDTVEKLTVATGLPAAPVRVANCVFGAWSGSEPTWFKACGGTVVTPVSPITKAPADARLVYRVNQRNVALNSTGDGGVWAEHEGELAFVGHWEEATQQVDDQNTDTKGASIRTAEKQCVEGGADAPVAGSDELGARPRSSVIDVLYNDDDVNCEPIAIISDSITPSSGDWGTVIVIDNGQHLLFTPSQSLIDEANTRMRPVVFKYAIEDTSGHRSESVEVRLLVCGRDARVNAPPALRPKAGDATREMRATVEEGSAISYNVLGDWWDPDGDQLVLASAVADKGEVAATPDGVVRYSANGVAPGPQPVAVTMTDGVATTTETLEVMVKANGSSIAPVVSNDFLTLVEGATGTVYPLANDSDPNEDQLQFVPGDWPTDSPGYRAVVRQGSAVEITGLKAGTYALGYEASDNVERTKGTIRLVVLAPDGANHAPTAVPDQVQLRADRVVNVDVLINDVDADGDILALAGVQGPDGSPSGVIRASVVDRRLIQLEVVPGEGGAEPSGTFQLSYSLVDGHELERAQSADTDEATKNGDVQRALGSIIVTVVPASKDQPPMVAPDAVVVRSGDLTAVPVLLNDSDPDGDPLTLIGPEKAGAQALEANGELVTWTSGRSLMVFGRTPGSYTLLYSISANGKEASGRLTVTVTQPVTVDHKNNPPSPRNLVLRAVKGAEVRLRVPLFGIDIDGDSATLRNSFADLQGAASGNSVRLDPNDPQVLLFTASPGSAPTDSFTYSVQDAYGGVGSATVNVVVQDNQGWPPVAHDDVLTARPGRTLYVSLLGNDASPQDLRLSFDEKPFWVDGVESETAAHPGAVELLDQSKDETWGRVIVHVPTDGALLVEKYRVTDGHSQSSASLRLSPDPAAPNMPPIAGEDVVKASEVLGKSEVVVEVLKNDFDPDNAGDNAHLTVSLPAFQIGTVASGKVTIPLLEQAQVVLYRLTDDEGGSTIGLVRVPGRENHPPQLNAVGNDASQRQIEAASLKPIPISLTDIVEDPDGDPFLLTDTAVVVEGGDTKGTVKRLSDGSGFEYTPPAQAQESFQATLQFEVTDRPNMVPEQRQEAGCNCLSTLRVGVSVKGSSPPRVVQPGSVEVPVFKEEAHYNLAPLMVDDQGDALTFVLADGKPGGLDITQSGPGGSLLTIVSRVPKGTIKPGQRFTFTFTADDGNFEPVQNVVTITIVPSNMPAPATAVLPVQQAERDNSFALPNLVNAAFNPFPGDPFPLINSSVDGGALLTCSEAGACNFLSAQVGTFTVRYTLEDSGLRQATGSVTVVVKGKPRAPGVPKIDSVGDHVVNLSWTPADMQGGTLQKYVVTAVETGETMSFASTGGQFTGLDNGSTYHFTVLAENELGDGESSLPSSPAIPDRVPDPPVNPKITSYGDSRLTLVWEPAPTAGDFTAITAYEVSIGGKTFTTTGALTVSATGLQNGTDYTFTVRARNSAPVNNGWGDWSVASAPERPSRHPDTPAAPTATNSGDGGTPRLTVTWAAPAFDGGRPISSYNVCVQGTSNCQTITTGLQATFNAGRNSTLRFTVQAVNTDVNDPQSDVSAASAGVTAVGAPDAPVISSVASANHQLTVTASTTNNSGCASYSIQYRVNSGAWQSSNVFNGLANGTSYSVTAKAVLGASCWTSGSPFESAASAPFAQTPYGPLVAPTMNGSMSGTTISWNWSANRSDDGRPGWAATLSGECAGMAVPNGSYSHDYGYSSGSKTCRLTVSAPGLSSLSAEYTNGTPAPPARSISTSIGGLCEVQFAGAHCVKVSGSNFTPGAALQVLCGGNASWFNFGAVPDGAGNFGPTQSVCYHVAGTPQTITIREKNNPSLQAQTTSNW
jgi:hypothetical protein